MVENRWTSAGFEGLSHEGRSKTNWGMYTKDKKEYTV